MQDPWAEQMERIVSAVRTGSGELPADLRQAILDGAPVPEPLDSYVKKVVANPHAVSDADFQALVAAGFTEDQIYEATIGAALAAGLARLHAGLDALREAADED